MSKVPKWGYGSKRRIRMIYWSPYQIAGVIALAISLMAFGFVLARLLASLTMDQQQEQEDSPSQSGANSAHSISATLNPSGVLSNYKVTCKTADFTITRRTATVTTNAAGKTYGDIDPVLSGTLSGFLGADSVTATYTRTSGEAVAGSPYTISATLTPVGVLGNYNVPYNTALFTIAKRTVSVTPNAASKIYGTADPTLTGVLTGFLASDAVTATYTRTAGETVIGGPYVITATLSPAAVLGNYDITYVTAQFIINQAPAAVTPNPAGKTYGNADPSLTGSLTGFLAADNVTATYSRTPGESVAGNPYMITATLNSAGVLGNYEISYNTAQFTIAKLRSFCLLTSQTETLTNPAESERVFRTL